MNIGKERKGEGRYLVALFTKLGVTVMLEGLKGREEARALVVWAMGVAVKLMGALVKLWNTVTMVTMVIFTVMSPGMNCSVFFHLYVLSTSF